MSVKRKGDKTMIRRIGIAVLVAFALAIGLSARAQEKSSGVMLTAEELQKLVEPSLLIAGRSEQFNVWFGLLLVRGGTAYDVYTQAVGNGEPEKGKWRLDGDKVCVTWLVFGHLGDGCRHLYRLVDGSYEFRLVPGEKLDATFRIVNKQ